MRYNPWGCVYNFVLCILFNNLLLGYFFGINFNAHFNMNMYVILSSTCFGPWHAHLQEEQLYKHSIWYPRSTRQLHTTPLSTGVVCSRLVERGYQMLCLCSCSSWRWACQGPKHVEDNVTYMFILECALKLVLKNIFYSSVFQLLWDRGPVNSFFIKRGPGPNKFTHKYLHNFFF